MTIDQDSKDRIESEVIQILRVEGIQCVVELAIPAIGEVLTIDSRVDSVRYREEAMADLEGHLVEMFPGVAVVGIADDDHSIEITLRDGPMLPVATLVGKASTVPPDGFGKLLHGLGFLVDIVISLNGQPCFNVGAWSFDLVPIPPIRNQRRLTGILMKLSGGGVAHVEHETESDQIIEACEAGVRWL